MINYLVDSPYDITPKQWGLLNRLWEKDGISQKELSEITVKDQTTLTKILDKLEIVKGAEISAFFLCPKLKKGGFALMKTYQAEIKETLCIA